MRKLTITAFAAIAMFLFLPQQAEAQHFHRGFWGPGFGGSGFNVSIGRGFGPGFGGFGPAYGFNRGVGFVNPAFYRVGPVNSFYRGGFNNGFHRGFHRGGCGW